MDFSILSPYLNTLAAGFLFLLVVSFYLSQKRHAGKGKLAPEAEGGWPIIGHLLLFGGNKPPHQTLGAMADKHGPIFTFRLGFHPALVISGSELAKECFTTNDLSLASRPNLILTKHFGYAMFGFAPHGPFWRETRKLVTLELLSNRKLELLKHHRIYEVATFLKELHRYWTSKKDSNSGFVLVDMKKRILDLTLNVILKIVAGKRYSVESDSNSDDLEEARRIHKALDEFFRLIGAFVPGDAIPFLAWLDLGGYEKDMKKTAKELDAIFQEWIDEHKRKRAVSGENSHRDQDFIDVMLSVFGDSKFAGYEADSVNKATNLVMISGASDTTAVTLIWAMSLLVNNRDALKKAQEELDKHVGRDRVVDESDLTKMVYLQSVVKETLRLYPPAPLSAPHLFVEDCTIGGYHVWKGTRLFTNLWKIQTDPRAWPEPFEFKPERFLTTHKDVDVRGKHFELIPFGSGRRGCPGTSFGLQLVTFVLASFLHAFEITTPSNELIDMTEGNALTILKASPLDLLLKPRLPAQLYG
ncbi:hypothetical protein UlMin_034393 [Ulmus minor]